VAAGRAGDDVAGGAAPPRVLAGARRAAPDVAHRQPAGERAHRIGPARDPAAGRRFRRGHRGGARADRAAARAARPGAGGRDRGLPALWGDQQRLVQVVVNLLVNASKFGPADTAIRLQARPAASGGIEFWVEDQGPGPKTDDETVLFRQFIRSGGEDPEESGLGLGLYIVRSIVERHGGRVSLRRAPTTGTRAWVELPVGARP